MCNRATVLILIATVLVAGLAQAQAPSPVPDWRQIGNWVVEKSLCGPASGPVARVWYSQDSATLFVQTGFVQTSFGRLYQTTDFENWRPATAAPPPMPVSALVPRLPESGATARMQPGQRARVYAFGNFVYRSDDGGANWENLTAYHSASIVGPGLRDLAIAPNNGDELVVAGEAGVFRSADGGLSWSSLNEGLPNLPATRLLNLPGGDQGVKLALANDETVEWPPGDKQAWLPTDNTSLASESQLRDALGSFRDSAVTALTVAGDFVYTGMQDGAVWVSADRGVTWRTFSMAGSGPVERFWVDPADPRVALAALGASPPNPFAQFTPVHVLHTINGGAFWDDFTANLPDVPAHGVAADRASGALYVATDRGVFMTYADLASLGAAQPWTALSGLPAAAAADVKLDLQGNQLWAAVDGYGVFATLAPHRLRDPSVVSAADFVARAVAPGSLISILGAGVDSARAGEVSAPVLASTATESQVQVPFEARGTSISFAASVNGKNLTWPAVALAPVAPVIFVDRDGSPMLLDSDNGVMLDAMNPARSGARIQILATGLGRVTPDWPTGLAAPLENSPRVAATVHAYLDRAPVEVTRAVLAPGYIGFYVVEIAVPKLVNYGPAELYIDVDGASSNRVRVYIEP
jgi:uncharacterized protein (TIGR03437 family)